MTTDDRPRCGRPVPAALRGQLKPSACRLVVNDGPHAGQHKATMTIPGWGKVTWTWKDTPPRKKRPEVALPKTSFPHSAFNPRRSER